MTGPCSGCNDRHRACQDTCERLKAWKDALEERKKAKYHRNNVFTEGGTKRQKRQDKWHRRESWE